MTCGVVRRSECGGDGGRGANICFSSGGGGGTFLGIGGRGGAVINNNKNFIQKH